MIVYEFYLKESEQAQQFETLCANLSQIGNKVTRKADNKNASPIFAISRNPNTEWIQVCVDENTPGASITLIETGVSQLHDTTFKKYSHAEDNKAPIERTREQLMI